MSTPAPVPARMATPLVERDGLVWGLRERTDDRLGPGPHELDLARLLTVAADPGSVFVDVGAHVGHYAVRLAASFSSVLAIEPNRATCRMLRMNLRLNGIRNVRVCAVAAHSERGRVLLWDPFNATAGSCTRTWAPGQPVRAPAGIGVSTLYWGLDGPGGHLGEVEARTVDELTARFRGHVRLMKIDVEGNEAAVLRGARRTICQDRPTMLIEMHHDMYGQEIWDEVVTLLNSVGYRWARVALPQISAVSSATECIFLLAAPADAPPVQLLGRLMMESTITVSSS